MQISTTKEPLNDRSISPHFRDSKKKKIAVYMYYVVSCKFCCMFELTTTQLKLIHSSFGKHHNIQEQRGGHSVSKLHHIEQPSTMSTKICFRTFEVNSFL